MHTKLFAAVEIFKTLGWENLTADNLLQLPKGTPEQQKLALQGLQKGDWLERVQIEEYTWVSKSLVDVELSKLALFAIRIGVSANRALQIANYIKSKMLCAQVIATRGEAFIAEFIAQASKHRGGTHLPSTMAGVSVYLVHTKGLKIPQTVDYLKDWVLFTEILLLRPSGDEYALEKLFFPVEILQPRILEHIVLAIELGLPATGPFGAVFLAAVKQGILSRKQALELAFFALDATVRPGDKKVWLQTLDELSMTDLELCDKAQVLIPLVATGENTIINRFVPRLVHLLDDGAVIELLIAAFSMTHKKSLQQILKVALTKEQLENAQSLAPWLSHLIENQDQPIINLVHKLSQNWQISLEKQEEIVQQKGLWRKTPDVWQVPIFAIGEVSHQTLLDHMSLIYAQSAIDDIYLEQFLASLIAFAYQDEEEARKFFVGIKQNNGVFRFVQYWLEGFPTGAWFSKYVNDLSDNPLSVRYLAIQPFIGKLPCLLSTPSKWDLSISLHDLVARMQRYQQIQLAVVETDLWVALGRLDLSTVTTELSKILDTLNLTVKIPNGDIISDHAGMIVLTYIQYPPKEPPVCLSQFYAKAEFDLTESLPALPKRVHKTSIYNDHHLYALFPFMGDASLLSMVWFNEVDHNLGLILRQIVRRAQPLPPGGAINLLATQRQSSSDSCGDKFTAVIEAWERGLLRPNVADVKWLDWSNQAPTHLVSFINALEGIAEEGLLSVVWPILDDLVMVSLKASRLLSGTAEIVQLIWTLLPEVELAIQKGLTDASALALPGVRSLADKSGQSKAVRIAQNIVAAIPNLAITEKILTEEHAQISKNTLVSEQEFAQVWYLPEKLLPYLDDGVAMSIGWQDSDKKEKNFIFTLALPDESNYVFKVLLQRYYLSRENQVKAYKIPKSATDAQLTHENSVWLYWDESSQKLTYQDRQCYKDKNTPLSSTLLVISLALLAQNSMNDYYSLMILSDRIKAGSLTAESVLKSVEILLQYPIVNPSKLVRNLETDNKYLSTLWPILTQTIQAVGLRVATEPLPVWINRLLDVAIRHAPYLKMAMEKGLIQAPYSKWPGLKAIAQAKGKSVAIVKAQKLIELLAL